ncbi:phage holin family protein [Bacillus cereus]|uniref:phage holin family protein n=1 Tax=Bacillus cereus TaxID=1396 RepID=UPI003CFF58FF
MAHIASLIKIFGATFGAFCGYFFGGLDVALKVMVIIAVIDYLSGMIAAGYSGELKSKIGFKGIAKKVMLFLLIGVAAQLDSVFGSNSGIREATIFFFVGNEALSVLENAGRIGIKLPTILTSAVEVLNNEQKKEHKKEK